MTNRTDNFNRADSALVLGTPSDGGSDWVAVSGTWGISSNQGYLVAGVSQDIATLESSVADVDVQVTLAAGVPGDDGINARETDDNNYLLFAENGSGYRLYKKVAGSFTQLGSTYSTTPANGDVQKFDVNGSALTCYVNGTSRITATDSFNSTATKHGLRSNGTTNCKFDDFSIVSNTKANAGFMMFFR